MTPNQATYLHNEKLSEPNPQNPRDKVYGKTSTDDLTQHSQFDSGLVKGRSAMPAFPNATPQEAGVRDKSWFRVSGACRVRDSSFPHI